MISEDQFMEAMKIGPPSTPLVAKVLVLVGIFCGGASLYLRSDDSSLIFWLYIVIVVTSFPFIVWSRSRKLKKIYAQDITFQEPVSVTINESGVQWVNSHATLHHVWSDFVRYKETANIVLLYPFESIFLTLDKHALSEEELSLLRAHLK